MNAPATPLHDMVELIRAIVRSELATTHIAEIGVVTRTLPHAASSDKNNYACDVKLRDSGLTLKAVPVSTQRIGAVAMPNVDDLVLLNFIGGDVHGAVIVARLYNDVDRPPVAKDQEWAYVSVDDKASGVRRAHFEFPNGNTATLDDDQLVIEMGTSRLTIKNAGDVELVGAARIDLRCDGDLSLKAQGAVSIEAGTNLSVKAGTDATLEGLSVAVKAQTSADIKGSAAASLKAPLLTLGGNVNVSPS
jgi:phage baseplate assembly protein gpV